jgi:hypothetical protein
MASIVAFACSSKWNRLDGHALKLLYYSQLTLPLQESFFVGLFECFFEAMFRFCQSCEATYMLAVRSKKKEVRLLAATDCAH